MIEKDRGEADNAFESSSEEEQNTESTTEAPTDNTTDQAAAKLPWIYRRDGVQSGRDHTYQLHLRSDTRKQEKQFQAELEDRIGEDIYKADLREACLLAGMDNVEDVLSQLEEWGYNR